MIQFNLLPDVKLEYMKARRSKRLVLLASTLFASLALAIFIGLFIFVNIMQRQHLSALDKDIARDTAQLESIPDLGKILTVQNQLNSLTALHEQDPATARLFDYLGQLTPQQATISDVNADFTTNSTISITGNADALSTVNQFVDTLKFTTYKIGDGEEEQKAFSNVVMASFSKNETTTSYQIDLTFDPAIFDNTLQIELVVPQIISTRSEVDKPTDLFLENQVNQEETGL